jgi:two-component system sensor histidine kinase and response regulator WspE
MRPFADGVEALPRMVRDLARSLGREVRLEIVGGTTQVDRDILSKLDAPLGHLLRNALDHGIEPPDVRRAAGKPAEGLIRIEARHSAGALHIIVSDDGRGINVETVREAVVARRLTTREASHALSESELLEFLFLPGFSMRETVTDVSGRGVGLDVVHDMVKAVRGVVRVASQPGKGMRFQLQLPVTLSVVRTLLWEIGGEPYAMPLAYIVRTLRLPKDKIRLLEGRQHFEFDGRHIGLVTARQVLGVDNSLSAGDELPVIVVGDQHNTYGLVVDRFLGERELVVQPLDPLLGKVKDVSAGALMEDGSPVLIVDAEDMIRSMDKLVSAGRLAAVPRETAGVGTKKRKRVLVVDDSLTVRELERKLIGNGGYEVEVAVDGMDGWNAVRTGHFDLVVTDIDMPRMDGIELVSLINHDPALKSVPVMIVSYKDREEDRQRGLEAGAAYYLTKGSFHDATLLQAVVDLIGEPVA